MSDDEEVYSEEESEEPAAPAPAPSGPTEAELAMQRRKAKTQVSSEGLDEAAKELLEANAQERDMMAQEIEELRTRSEQRKKERQREEQEIAARRAEEDARRKQEEEDRKRQKEEQEKERKAKRDAQMQEFAKMQNTKANFVIIKKSNELVGGGGDEEKEDGDSNKMSREQMEQERKAILAQRIQPLEVDGADEAKLKSKAESLHKEILRLEGEKYDLEKRFREQQTDMLEMAERARNINKVGKTGLKRVTLKEDERDTIQEKFSGAPSKIELYSRFERQPDKRAYKEKFTVFSGPTYRFPAEKINPTRTIKWDEDSGLPSYEGGPAGESVAAEE